jgi:PPOX class probable F420-dependent enzyme
MASLSDDRVRSFVLHGTRTGKIAWVASDGAPHVVPIWFVLDGDDVVFNTGADTGKGKSLAREGRASLVVDDDTPPFSFVKIDGTVTLHDDLDEVRRFATAIGGRYMGADRAVRTAPPPRRCKDSCRLCAGIRHRSRTDRLGRGAVTCGRGRWSGRTSTAARLAP